MFKKKFPMRITAHEATINRTRRKKKKINWKWQKFNLNGVRRGEDTNSRDGSDFFHHKRRILYLIKIDLHFFFFLSKKIKKIFSSSINNGTLKECMLSDFNFNFHHHQNFYFMSKNWQLIDD